MFDPDTAARRAGEGDDVILCRIETSPEDIRGMHAARGIVTARGGMTSHAAVVARSWGRPCVSGAGALVINAAAGTMRVGERRFAEGDPFARGGVVRAIEITPLSDSFQQDRIGRRMSPPVT